MMIAGPGVASGGVPGMVLKKASDVDYDTTWGRVGFSDLTGQPADNSALAGALDDKADVGHNHNSLYYLKDDTYSALEVDALLGNYLEVEPDPDWGSDAVKTGSIRAVTFGENDEQGTVTLVPWIAGSGGTGFVELDLIDFDGGATFGGAVVGNKIVMSRYGTITAWAFDHTPYVILAGNHYQVFHEGNFDPSDYVLASELITTLADYRLIDDEKAVFVIAVTDPNASSAITTGDGKGYFTIPAELNGWDLVRVEASVTTTSSSGTPTFQIANVTQAADMLSTKLTVDAGDLHSKDATAPAVIDTSNDDVATGDQLRFDFDVAGTGVKGVTIILTFQRP